MLHEERDIISKLKIDSKHFARIFDKHNALDTQIAEAEKSGHFTDLEVEKLKKEKLLLKDEIYSMIVKYKKENS